jgi:23S rRNA-/tRNA-specific pseudouridylate synthase
VRGDPLYAPVPLQAARLLLHAEQLALAHPATSQALHFHSAAAF